METSPEPMKTFEILTLADARSTSIKTLFTIYTAVIAGILTLIATGKPLPYFTKYGLIVIFLLFAITDLVAILQAVGQQKILLSMIRDTNPAVQKLTRLLLPAHWMKVAAFHIVIDLTIAGAIYFLL